jgi:hypothetical protein
MTDLPLKSDPENQPIRTRLSRIVTRATTSGNGSPRSPISLISRLIRYAPNGGKHGYKP